MVVPDNSVLLLWKFAYNCEFKNSPTPSKLKYPYLDEVVGSPPAHCAAPDLRVVDQILRPGEALVHPLDSEEG